MRKRIRRVSPLILALLGFQGCTIFNPYDEDAHCKARDDAGRCTSMQGAYESSLNRSKTYAAGAEPYEEGEGEGEQEGGSPVVPLDPIAPSLREQYEGARYEEITGLLGAERTPLVEPVKVRTVLLVGYTDDKTYFRSRYAHIIVSEPRFVLEEFRGGDRDNIFELFEHIDK